MSKTDTFTCGCCGETFEKGWSDEEADAEFAEDFPNHTREDSVVICDDCHKRLKVALEAGFEPQKALAERYGVNPSHISRIKNDQGWDNV